MQKITLQPGEVVEINNAIVGLEIVDTLLDLQLGIDHPGASARENNIGIEESQNSYRRLIMFFASEADYFADKEKLASWLTSITLMMDEWNKFRLPGTEKVQPF